MANVLSTTHRAPAAWAAAAAAAMSTTLSSGFVGDSTQTMRVRASSSSASPSLSVVHGRELEVVALGLVDLREDPVGAAVDVVHGHDPVARREQVEHGRDRAHAGREREPVSGALERGEALLERGARGIGRARVVEALVDADLLLHVGRGLVDRHDDRARGRVGLLPDVDRAGLEVHPVTPRRGCGGPPGTRAGRPA